MNKILLEADEFVTEYGLDDSQNVIRRGALLFHHPDDFSRLDKELTYLGNDGGTYGGKSLFMGMAACYAAGFLSITVSAPSPELGGTRFEVFGIARLLHR